MSMLIYIVLLDVNKLLTCDIFITCVCHINKLMYIKLMWSMYRSIYFFYECNIAIGQVFIQKMSTKERLLLSNRAESYSVQTRTGPWTGSDRTGPDRTEAIRSGPRSKAMSYSVLGPVPVWTGGPVDRTGGPNNIEEGFFFLICCMWHGRAMKHGTTVPKHWPESRRGSQTFQV